MNSIMLNVFTGEIAKRGDLPIAHTMSGIWPQHEMSENSRLQAEELHVRAGEEHHEIQRLTPSPTQNSSNEHFFDSMSRQSTPPTRIEESSVPSYLRFETGTSSISELGDSDWRYYDLPRELIECQSNSSRQIKDILKSSIDRIQARHNEEADRLLRDMANEEMSRVPTSEQPILEIPEIEQLDLSSSTQDSSPNVDVGRVVSSPWFDSVYIAEPKSKPTRSGFGFGMFFRKSVKSKVASPTQQESTTDASTSIQSLAQTEIVALECVSCLDDFNSTEMIKLVCHSYCKECFQRLISTALESETHWPAKCCLNTIPSAEILPHLDPAMKKTYKKREDEWSIPVGERMYCSQPACSTWIAPRYIKAQTNTARCPTCRHDACVTCRGPSHGMADCPQDPNLQMTNNLASLEGWKRCYQCRAVVEHNTGCRHITCLCKAQFCYICTKKWKTCVCTDADLGVIHQRANNIRQEAAVRTAREIAEVEEVRIAIQMVEEFRQAEEAILMLEVEVESRRQEEVRQRREDDRILAVNRLYSQLNIEMETLHSVQRVRIAERHDAEAESLMISRQEALDTLSARQSNEVHSLGVASETKISTMEAMFNQEYQNRLTAERRIEDNYVDQLFTYWTGKSESEYRIREARDELRKEQDNQYQTWNARRRAELHLLINKEHRKMKTLRAKHAGELITAEGSVESNTLEWGRKKWAESQWVDEVVRERVIVLQEKEQEEYSRGV